MSIYRTIGPLVSYLTQSQKGTNLGMELKKIRRVFSYDSWIFHEIIC